MYFNLSGKLTRMLIEELKHFFSYFPDFRSPQPEMDLVKNIKSKYSFGERAARYIVVRASGSSNHQPISADDFRGYTISYCGLRHVEGAPNVSIEWIGENALEIQRNGGIFPSSPGFYFIEVCEEIPSEDESRYPSHWKFFVTPIYTVENETVFKVTDTEYILDKGPVVSETLRLYRMPGNILLRENVNFEVSGNGEILLYLPLGEGEFLSADYRIQGETLNPKGFRAFRNRATLGAIPGVFLAFGQRITPGDRMMVEVSEFREIQSLEFGGRWETSIDIDVVDKDIDSQREILEHALIFLRAQLRTRWSGIGIEILQVNAGGESEELYDQNDFFYRGSISLSIETEWTTWVPTAGKILRLETTEEPEDLIASLSDEDIHTLQDGIRLGNRLVDYQDPFYDGKTGSISPTKRNPTFPLIS